MRYLERYGEDVAAYQDADLEAAKSHFDRAFEIWRDGSWDAGTCVLGCGITVWYVVPRGSKPKRKVVVRSPFQGDGRVGDGLADAMAYLQEQGFEVSYDPGTMD